MEITTLRDCAGVHCLRIAGMGVGTSDEFQFHRPPIACTLIGAVLGT